MLLKIQNADKEQRDFIAEQVWYILSRECLRVNR